ncbi:hypothetical protein A2690_00885 [Candidatus Roizmanbacteria bacterium RIFCSPHIGHO2_01_FULL_39_12b]|uniref:DUF4325 domain-containing protein n=1 Tax=Candidatus Roizmanbacteria bacterium RIFCSPHIGHO2_01_FULL_39_12b TaxID=1802030 RepID=A0A1F7GAV4_9BACT|nr:MAG: hypothetical protein A2690_00885 [Candidatus Roizmanbacteria bacterium RIFCSPHIGHO2_01_FULL_39_12b]
MHIKLSQFGKLLISRPSGREAYLAAKAYILPEKIDKIEIDFSGVQVATPSWLDEFISPIKEHYGKEIFFSHTDNPSVQMSLEQLGMSGRVG